MTDTGSQSFASRLPGISDATITATIFANASSIGLATFSPGTAASWVATLGSTASTCSGTFLIESVSAENPARNPVKLTLTGQSSGVVSTT